MAKAKKPVKKPVKKKPAKSAAASKKGARAAPRRPAKAAKAKAKGPASRRKGARKAAPKRAAKSARRPQRAARPTAPAPAIAGPRTVPPKQPPSAPGQPDLKVGDDAVQKATGKTWAQWCEALDAAGARAMAHSDIARLVFERFRVGPWWAQMVTVGYEQARGMRELHEQAEGYSVSASKTLAAPAERVYAAWNLDAERGRWLGMNLKVRSATPPKSVRLIWSDQLSQVAVMLHPRGAAKTQVAVEHTKLKDQAECARMKTFWAGALQRLGAALEQRPGGAAGGR
jgi:hypothetical protein